MNYVVPDGTTNPYLYILYNTINIMEVRIRRPMKYQDMESIMVSSIHQDVPGYMNVNNVVDIFF